VIDCQLPKSIEPDKEISKNILTKQDVTLSWIQWYFFAEMSNSFARLQSVACCACMIPILTKLYKTPQQLSEGLTRYLGFFNAQGIWGSIVHGMIISLEEKRANGEDISNDLIDNMKTNLMGPISGIGDTIDWGLLKPIVLGFFIPLAMVGNIYGSLLPFSVFTIITMTVSYKLWHNGYQNGQESISALLSNGKIHQLISGLGILGLMIMGFLAANFITINIFVQFPVWNSILPGFSSLAAIFASYLYMQTKGANFIWIFLIITTACCTASLFGVL
jgi:D-glucosaminate-specific PTS system IID component